MPSFFPASETTGCNSLRTQRETCRLSLLWKDLLGRHHLAIQRKPSRYFTISPGYWRREGKQGIKCLTQRKGSWFFLWWLVFRPSLTHWSILKISWQVPKGGSLRKRGMLASGPESASVPRGVLEKPAWVYHVTKAGGTSHPAIPTQWAYFLEITEHRREIQEGLKGYDITLVKGKILSGWKTTWQGWAKPPRRVGPILKSDTMWKHQEQQQLGPWS